MKRLLLAGFPLLVILGLRAAPLTGEAQPARKIPLVGYLSLGAVAPPAVFVSRWRSTASHEAMVKLLKDAEYVRDGPILHNPALSEARPVIGTSGHIDNTFVQGRW